MYDDNYITATNSATMNLLPDVPTSPNGPSTTSTVWTAGPAVQDFQQKQTTYNDLSTALQTQSQNQQTDPIQGAALGTMSYDELLKSNPSAAFYRANGRAPTAQELEQFNNTNNPKDKTDSILGAMDDSSGSQVLDNMKGGSWQPALAQHFKGSELGIPLKNADGTDNPEARGEYVYQGDGKFVNINSGATITSSTGSTNGGSSGGTGNDYQTQQDQIFNTTQNQLQQIMQGTFPLTAEQQAQIQQVRQAYDRLKRDQEVANANEKGGIDIANIRQGIARYAPGEATGLIANVVSKGLQKINDIEQEALSAMAALKQSFLDKNYEMISKNYERVSKYLKDKDTTIKETHKAAMDAIKQNLENQKTRLEIQKLLTEPARDKDKRIQDFIFKQAEDYPGAFAGLDPDQMEKLSVASVVQLVINSPSYKQKLQKGQADIDKIYSDIGNSGAELGLRVRLNDAQIKNLVASTGKTYAEIQALSDAGQINVDGSPSVSGALQVILGSGKFTKDQARAIKNAILNGEDPFTVVKNQARGIMQGATATKVENLEIANDQLNRIDTLLKAYYAAGGETGIFTGNYEKSLNKLGQIKDAKLVGIASSVALAMQAYRLAVTGTAASVQEDARIDRVFPGINNSKGLNEARLKELREFFSGQIDSAYRNVLGSSYDQLKSGQGSGVPDFETYKSQMKQSYPTATDEQIKDFYQKIGGKVSSAPASSSTAKTTSGGRIVAGYDIGSYATDPNHEKRVASIYSKVKNVVSGGIAMIDTYLRKFNSPVTGANIASASQRYGVDAAMLLAIMEQDSSHGTKGKGARTRNPGNVGNDDTGRTVTFRSWQEGVDAVARNLAKRKV